MTAPSTLVGPPETEHGEPIVAHIVRKDRITDAYVFGTPLEALCGKVFVPSRDPKTLPLCSRCKEIADGAWGGYDREDLP